MPEVSVIIPNYNHSAYLKQRIDSILNQTYQDFELILLDDCSKDNSREVIEEYRHHPKVVAIIFNETNAGTPFLQWEKGMKIAAGKWLWIAESDDYADPGFLETLIGMVRLKPNVGIAYVGSHWVNGRGEIGADLSSYTESFYKNGIDEIKEKLWYVCTIQNGSSAIFRKDIAIKCIKGMGKYRSCGDWIFYVKMLHCSDLAFTGEKLNFFRYYHANTSNWASQHGLWITEGVDILKEIDFGKVKFTLREFKRLIGHWIGEARKLDNTKRRRKVRWTLLQTIFRYLFSI